MSIEKNNRILSAITFAAVILLVGALAWLSSNDEDPCSHPQNDISAAVLADQDGDQDALINRALIMKGKCEQKSP